MCKAWNHWTMARNGTIFYTSNSNLNQGKSLQRFCKMKREVKMDFFFSLRDRNLMLNKKHQGFGRLIAQVLTPCTLDKNTFPREKNFIIKCTVKKLK